MPLLQIRIYLATVLRTLNNFILDYCNSLYRGLKVKAIQRQVLVWNSADHHLVLMGSQNTSLLCSRDVAALDVNDNNDWRYSQLTRYLQIMTEAQKDSSCLITALRLYHCNEKN